MTKSLTAALILSLLTFLSLGPLGKTTPTNDAGGVNFFSSDGVSLNTGDDGSFDM